MLPLCCLRLHVSSIESPYFVNDLAFLAVNHSQSKRAKICLCVYFILALLSLY